MKDKIMGLSIAAAVELMIFLALVKLSDISLYFWIADAAILSGFIVTGRSLFLEVQDKIDQRNIKIAQEMETFFDNLSTKNTELELNISRAIELAEANSKSIDSFSKNIEMLSEKLDRLSSEVSEASKKSSENITNYINSVDEQYQRLSDSFSNNMSQSVRTAVEELCGVYNQTADQITNLANQRIDKLDESCSTILNKVSEVLSGKIIECFEAQTKSEETFVSGLSEANSSVTTELTNKLDKLSLEQSERIEKSFKEAVSGYTQSFNETNVDIKESIKKLVEAILAFITAGNTFNADLKKLLEENCIKQMTKFEIFTKDFGEKIKELNKKICQNSETHFKETGEIQEQIKQITENYEKMFTKIIENQKEMQSMTNEDMEFLKQLVK